MNQYKITIEFKRGESAEYFVKASSAELAKARAQQLARNDNRLERIDRVSAKMAEGETA